MIGNIEDARLIYFRRKSGNGPMPKGWRKIGEGVYRTAYLSPGGVVYKICRTAIEFADYSDCTNNDGEYENYLRIRKSKPKYKGWRVNPVHSFKFMDGDKHITVNASPFVKGVMEKIDYGKPGSIYNEQVAKIETAFHAFGIEDGHDENYIKTKRGRVIIDLAGN